MTAPTAKHYEALYKNGYSRGRASPGVKHFNLYRKHLLEPVIDLGCGAGDAVHKIREAGLSADGIDWITFNPAMMRKDITCGLDLTGYNTAMCMDVLEHLKEDGINAVLKSMSSCKRQVITICTVAAKTPAPAQLHLTIKPAPWWSSLIKSYMRVSKVIPISDVTTLYLARNDGRNKNA